MITKKRKKKKSFLTFNLYSNRNKCTHNTHAYKSQSLYEKYHPLIMPHKFHVFSSPLLSMSQVVTLKRIIYIYFFFETVNRAN